MTDTFRSATEERLKEDNRPISPSPLNESETVDRIVTPECSSPIVVKGERDSAVVHNDILSVTSEKAPARSDYGDRPKIISGVTWDPDGSRQSIEIEPLFGESKEDCKARITQLFKELQADVKKCESPRGALRSFDMIC
jgi:hypothetical protein